MDVDGNLVVQFVHIEQCTCGEKNGKRSREFYKVLETSENGAKALDKMGVKKICCRRFFLTPIIRYLTVDMSKNVYVREDKNGNIETRDADEIKFGKEFPKAPILTN